MGALTHNGEVLQSLPANANQINFDKTGTDLNATQVENAIKEVNTKVNTNTTDIDQLKSGLMWHNIISSVTFVPGITVADARSYVDGNMFLLTLLLDITSIAGMGEILIGKIASTYSPNGKWRFTGISYSGEADSGIANMVSVEANGDIKVEHTYGKPYIECTIIYPLIN